MSLHCTFRHTRKPFVLSMRHLSCVDYCYLPAPSSTPFDSHHFLLSFRVSTGAFASKHSRPRRKSLHSRQCTRRSRGRHSPRFVYFSAYCNFESKQATSSSYHPSWKRFIWARGLCFHRVERGGGGILNKCLYGDPRSNPLPFKNGVHRSINVNAGWFFLLFDDVPYYRDFL